MFLTELEIHEYNTQWSIEDCDNNYIEASKAIDTFQGYLFYKIKNDLHKVNKTQWGQFCKKHNISQRVADSKISYFRAQCQILKQDDVIEAEIITYDEAKIALNTETSLNKIPYSSYEKLSGVTVTEKMKFYDEVKAHLDKEQPTRADINKYKKKMNSNTPKLKSENKDFSKELVTCAEKLVESRAAFIEVLTALKGNDIFKDYLRLLKSIYEENTKRQDAA